VELAQAAVGGPRTIREVVPLVDRVDLAHLDRLVERVRAVSTDVPIGVFLMDGCGDHPRVHGLGSVLGDSFMGSLLGEPEAVAEVIRSLAAHGIGRAQPTPHTPDTLALLAPHLAGAR
jgi:hypothetical protein